MATRFKQGYFVPKNPEKYVGNVEKIRYMSSWELQFDQFLDGNPNVLKWSSEEVAIPYKKPTDGKIHKYYPDILVCYKNKAGAEIWELIEIKPLSQTKPSRSRNRKTNLYETLTLAVNMAKWEAAGAWCKMQQQNGMNITFRIISEDSIFK